MTLAVLSTCGALLLCLPATNVTMTALSFFEPKALCSCWWFWRWQRKCCAQPTATVVPARRPLSVFFTGFNHVRHWTCYVPTSMLKTLLVAIAQTTDWIYFPCLNQGRCGWQQWGFNHNSFLRLEEFNLLKFHLLVKYFNTLDICIKTVFLEYVLIWFSNLVDFNLFILIDFGLFDWNYPNLQ